MKKSLLALAVLGAFAGVASAQSSVTIYGTVDLNGRYVKNDGRDGRYSLGQDGINSSQLVFGGREDLGGGGWAGFNLNMGVNADSGTTNNKTFNRRSTVSLGGVWGELRMGRDYTPTFWNYTIFDAFGTNGLGNSTNILPPALIQSTFVRADNSIGYLTPGGLAGFYGQLMVAAGEGGNGVLGSGQQASATSTGQTCKITGVSANCTTAVNSNSGHYIGGRVGFAAGPFDVAGSYAVAGQDAIDEDAKSWSVGGKFDFGFAKILGYYAETKLLSAKSQMYSISGVVRAGAGEIHLGWDSGKLKGVGSEPEADQVALGFVYNLSKRTAVYSTASMIKNKNGNALSVAGGTAIPGAPSVDGKSKGIEFGLRHFF
jgi:predicted porin